MRRYAPLLFVLVLAGCHGSHEADLPGTWTMPNGVTIVFDAAKTYQVSKGAVKVDGTWSIEGDKVTLTQKSVNGQPVATLKAALQKQRATLPANLQATIDRIGAPETYEIATDGKLMTKHESDGRTVTLSKSGT